LLILQDVSVGRESIESKQAFPASPSSIRSRKVAFSVPAMRVASRQAIAGRAEVEAGLIGDQIGVFQHTLPEKLALMHIAG